MQENNETPRCSGNCKNCIAFQRQFCASQLAYNNMKQIEALTAQVLALTEKIESMQSSDDLLFNPSTVPTASAAGNESPPATPPVTSVAG